jgi:hypothetical protein
MRGRCRLPSRAVGPLTSGPVRKAADDVEALPGNVRMRELYRRLFRFDLISPAVVFAITGVGAVAGIKIAPLTWPLAAAGVGGIAAAIVLIVRGDRSRARDLVEWQHAQAAQQWTQATGLPAPAAAEEVRAWVASPRFARARPVDQARALIALAEIDRARAVLSRATGKAGTDAASIAAVRFEIEFAAHGEADYDPWLEAVTRLNKAAARPHLASIAVHQAATEAATKGQWLITLDKAAHELGPFEIEPRLRALRLAYRAAPIIVAIGVVEIVYAAFGSAMRV